MVVNVTDGAVVHGSMTGSGITLCRVDTRGMPMTTEAITCPECRAQAASLAKGSQGVLDALNRKGG